MTSYLFSFKTYGIGNRTFRYKIDAPGHYAAIYRFATQPIGALTHTVYVTHDGVTHGPIDEAIEDIRRRKNETVCI